MGKGRKQKPKKFFGEKRRDKQQNRDDRQQSYEEIIRENKEFELYYKTQSIIAEDQWDSFISTLKDNLPVAFRITGFGAQAKALLKIIKGKYFNDLLNAKIEGEEEENGADKIDKMRPKCLPFYPDDMAWQLQLTRKDIRRSEAYFRLHNFLISETDTGSISRQEVVSMIPPLVLDVKPQHKVLDMCAAPGSKTAQLIEMIHSDESIPHPEGFVIANDLDNRRCYMLVHQAKRLNSANILITNHDSSLMPNLKMTNPDGTLGVVKFDRILADVPCSGDGTLRKNPDIWTKWTPANGNNLHGIQYRIAKRGLEMLAVGGRLVYSTCSLNPVENEAVLHRILQETGDSVHLVDGRSLVPGLKCNPGVSNWVLASKNMMFFKSWEEVPDQWRTQIRPKMFPPKPEDAHKYHLERSMRILPHHQDTGGFFVAILEKVKALPWEAKDKLVEKDADVVLDGEENVDVKEQTEADRNGDRKRNLDDANKQGPQRKRKKIFGFKEDPFVFFKDETESVWPEIKEFYGISDDLDPRCLLVRCQEGKKKNIYYTSPAIRDIVLLNENNVKMINTGVKTFVRCDNKNTKCAFRLAQEGMPSVFSFISQSRKIQIGKEDLIALLLNNDPHTAPEIDKLSLDTQNKIKNYSSGSCILLYEEKDNDNPNPLKFEVVGWRGLMSLRAYIPVCELVHYLRLLGADVSKFEKNKFEENRIKSLSENNDESKSEASNENNDTNDDKEVTEPMDVDVMSETT